MNKNIFIGMDLHKNSSTFSIKDKGGKLIETKKLPTDPSAIKGYLRKFPSSTLVMEPVSQWYFYADLIQDLGIDVHLAHPKRVKAIAEARIKTDKIDASVLCDLLRTNFLPEAYFSTPEARFWKEMVRFRASLINFRTQLKNKIHSILFKNAIRHPFASLFTAKGRKWLETLDLQEPFEFPLQRYLSMIDMIDMLVDEADQKVERLVSDHPQARLLTSIPGIGYVSGLTIIGEIGDISRFRSAKKLMGYAGLVPSTYASGEKIAHGRITKQGSRWLRYIMIETAHRQPFILKNGFGAYFNRIKGRRDSKAAAVATARKLVAVVWRILTDNRPFETIPPRREVRVAHPHLIVSR